MEKLEQIINEGRAEEYLEPIKIIQLGLYWDIPDLIRATKDPEKYLLEGQSLDDKNLNLNMLNVIKGTGDIEKYLDPEIAKRLRLREDQILELIIIARKSRRIFRQRKIKVIGNNI